MSKICAVMVRSWQSCQKRIFIFLWQNYNQKLISSYNFLKLYDRNAIFPWPFANGQNQIDSWTINYVHENEYWPNGWSLLMAHCTENAHEHYISLHAFIIIELDPIISMGMSPYRKKLDHFLVMGSIALTAPPIVPICQSVPPSES